MFENPRRGRQARNFTKTVLKILDLKSSSEQIFSENWRWVPLRDVSKTKLTAGGEDKNACLVNSEAGIATVKFNPQRDYLQKWKIS